MILHIKTRPSPMQSAYPLTFENRSTAQAIDLERPDQLAAALSQLAIPQPTAVLVLVGGAAGLSPEYLQRLETFFVEALCPFIETQGLVVIDGGTDAGVMQLIGQARARTRSSFPLVGVVVQSKIMLPSQPAKTDDAAPLEPNHTHFVLVPGQAWGDESTWIAQVADVLSGNQASVTLLINGGEIALHQDVPNSLLSRRAVLVVEGSGRSADRLAAALRGPALAEPELHDMVDSGLIQVMNLSEGQDRLTTMLGHLLKLAPHI